MDAQKPQKNRGIALLLAMMTIMIMISLVSDMLISRTVNGEMAMTIRDRIKAEYAAKSGANMGLFFASISWAWSLFQAQPNSPLGKQPLLDDDSSPWNLVNSFPPFGKTLVDMVKTAKNSASIGQDSKDMFNLGSLFSEKLVEKMQLFEDSFSVKVSDESRKINVNACYDKHCKNTIQQLTALFSCPAEKQFLDSQSITAEQLAYRIKDFINRSEAGSPESGYPDKNTPYEKMTPPYKAKGLPFDTIDELKMVDGWNDALHKVFADYLTVYPFPIDNNFQPKININTMDVGALACLLPSARESRCQGTFFVAMHQLKQNKKAAASTNGNIADFLQKTACLGESNTDSEGSKLNPVEWFDTKTPVLRIEVFGDTGSQRQTLSIVIRRIFPKEKVFGVNESSPKRSYQILFWKMT
jgi:type II secretory pathway component PulK